MEDATAISKDELSVLIEEDDEYFTIIAKEVKKNHWELSIENEYGIKSVWLEYFISAQDAIDAGIVAIREEGKEAFNKFDGLDFIYINENNTKPVTYH